MKKLTKKQQELKDKVIEFLLSLDDTHREEHWDTDRGIAFTYLDWFLDSLDISLDEKDLIQ